MNPGNTDNGNKSGFKKLDLSFSLKRNSEDTKHQSMLFVVVVIIVIYNKDSKTTRVFKNPSKCYRSKSSKYVLQDDH